MEIVYWVLLLLLFINVAATAFVAQGSTHVAKWMLFTFIWIFPFLGAVLSVISASGSTASFGPPDDHDWTVANNTHQDLNHPDNSLDDFSDSH